MILGAPAWIWPASLMGLVLLGAIAWSYRHPGAATGARTTAAAFKLAGVLALLLCLTDPLERRVHARPGANQLLILVDDSRSLSVRDRGAAFTRAEEVRRLTAESSEWALRAAQDFDLQRYAFDARVHPLASGEVLTFSGEESALAGALERLATRSTARPVAGIVLFTDGVSTDTFDEDFPWEALPPVHPVVIGDVPRRDVAVSRIEVSQTNFEQSPVTLTASVLGVGCEGEVISVELRGEDGEVLERQTVTAVPGKAQPVRFHAPAEASGVHFYSIVARFRDAPAAGLPDAEATQANNRRWAVVDRGSGPYRVLYVSGRPNWEYKFLQRALQEDAELELVGLIRIAKRQPKFTFRARADRRNTLWDGFDDRHQESAEEYDEPVLIRLGTRDEFELRFGFPRTAEELFPYHALITDDLEADFFTRDQMALVEQFVSLRGGGFLALGGEQSFFEGGYSRTPLGDLLPVYLDYAGERHSGRLELDLTREGWLEPWVRLRSTEAAERARLQSMPPFRTLNRVGRMKPGGIVLLEASDRVGVVRPALVVQRFGKGRVGALLLGDLWRWDLRRDDHETSDLGTAWRQVVRWLVSDVPRAVDLEVTRSGDSSAIQLRAFLQDESFEAVRNARPRIEIRTPQGEPIELRPTPSATEPGVWVASFVPRREGAYRALLIAQAEDGSEFRRAEAGWVSEPAAREFASLEPDRVLLEEIALRTGGSIVRAADLTAFAADLADREVPITDEELDPLWHRWWFFLIALGCLCAEWGVRRFHGLP
ncbi:MAG: hypothetical protein V3T22_03050 [Planctomycetota bacterium]